MVFNLPLSPLSILFLVTAGLLLIIAGLVWRSRVATRVTDWFLVVLISDAAWAITSTIPLEAGLPAVAFAGQVSVVVASSVAAVSWFVFALVYTGRANAVSTRRLAILTVPLIVNIIAFAVAPYHPVAISELMIDVRPTATVITYELEPLSLLTSGYTLSLVLTGTGFVVWTALTDPDLYADQTVGLVIGAMMPIAGTALTLSGVYELGSTNLTPATLGVTAIGYGYALFRTDVLQAGPSVAVQGEETAIEQLSEGFIITDSSGTIVDANTTAHELLDRSELSNQSITTVLETDSRLASGQHLFDLDDGTVVEAQITSMGVDRQQEPGQVITLRDVTARERRRERLQVLNRVLRHNVRNDLQVIHGFAQQIADGDVDRVDPPTAARRIMRNADSLLSAAEKAQIVEQRLDIDQKPRQESVDVSALLSDRVEAKRTEAATSVDIKTALPSECEIRSDRDVLRLVVDEILDNAIRHTGDSATVWVKLQVEDDIRVRISDNGPGIPEQERRPVLRGTETALDHAKQFGLWMVRWGVLYLDGDLSIRDRSPTGTVVEIKLQ